MVEATDELRRQIAEVIADYHGRMIQAHTLFRSYELAGELLPLVVAVVAEARTEQREADAKIAESWQFMSRKNGHHIEAAIREGGNQDAESEGND